MISPSQPPPPANTDASGLLHFSPPFPKIINRLWFRTNSHTIVPFLLSRKECVPHRPGFSLNALIEMPTNLLTPELPVFFRLSLQNTALPILDDTVRAGVVACLTPQYRGKLSPAELDQAIATARQELENCPSDKEAGDILMRIVDGQRSTGYFSHIDWALDHWGCIADISAVVPESFAIPTPCIEFETLAAPPILALQRLANTFPSVRFSLQYSWQDRATWSEVEFHPFPPFGY